MRTLKALRFIAAGAVLTACAGHLPSSARVQHGPKAVAVERYGGFAAPVSVLYDADRDRYLVSNVNGKATAKDNNGFISVLTPDGRVAELKWIAGGRGKVKLDAPKGLAIANDVLYVADVDVVRTFDIRDGRPRADIAVPGSTFLNDVTAGPDGKIYLSDSGPPTGRFDGRGTEAVYVIEHDQAKLLANGKQLGRPNGVVWTDRGLVVCPFGSKEIYRLDDKGQRRDVTQIPAGGLAGIVKSGDWLLVTSWQSSSVFRGKLGGRFEVALADQASPSDIGYDTRRSRLLVPHFTEDSVEAFQLE